MLVSGRQPSDLHGEEEEEEEDDDDDDIVPRIFIYIYAYSFLDVEVFDQVVLVWSSQIPQEGTLNLEE